MLLNDAKLPGALRLIRPVNSVMMGFAVLIGAVLASGKAIEGDSWLSLSLGFATGFALTAASMVFNDYFDREVDAVNQPRRPIPSGLVTPQEALLWGAFWKKGDTWHNFQNSYPDRGGNPNYAITEYSDTQYNCRRT
ncbi:MAG: UbiA family prenyltransferase [Candidatus Bathyarchaeia archaeon]